MDLLPWNRAGPQAYSTAATGFVVIVNTSSELVRTVALLVFTALSAEMLRRSGLAEGPVDVGRAPMPLQVRDDQPVVRGERGPRGSEHLAGPEAAVQEDQRPPAALGFVVEVEAV